MRCAYARRARVESTSPPNRDIEAPNRDAAGPRSRLNRQFLATAAGIASFRPAGRGRLLVTLSPPADDEVLVAQEVAGDFRRWVQPPA